MRQERASIYGLIACQGDSLTYGSRDPDGMSYPLYLGRLLSEKHHQTWVTVNLAVARDGWVEIPTGLGLGIEVDEGFVRRHAREVRRVG